MQRHFGQGAGQGGADGIGKVQAGRGRRHCAFVLPNGV